MESIKRDYLPGGIVKLPPNVTKSQNTVDRDLLADVEADDETHMALVIDYCSTTICKKTDPVKIFIHPSRHEKTGVLLLYTLFVGMPMTTVLEDDHFTHIKQISWKRITRPIKWEHDPEANLMRLEICINPMRCLPEIDDVDIVNIHIKQSRRLNIIHERVDDDKRGSTKRPRRDIETI